MPKHPRRLSLIQRFRKSPSERGQVLVIVVAGMMAFITAVGLVALMLVSSFVMELWVNLYAQDYGGFGVVMAIFFWIALSAAIVVWAAALSPPLAERRAARR